MMPISPTGFKAIILGNGPSLTKFLVDPNQLIGSIVCGVNRIYEFKSFPLGLDYYLALDRTLWRDNKKELFDLKAKKYCVYERYQDLALESFHKAKLEVLKYTQDPFEFSSDINLVGHGYSSTFALTQLMIQKGCNELEFFGVDYCKEIQSHFYGDRHRSKQFWTSGLKGMQIIIQKCNQLGIQLKINTINDSLVRYLETENSFLSVQQEVKA